MSGPNTEPARMNALSEPLTAREESKRAPPRANPTSTAAGVP